MRLVSEHWGITYRFRFLLDLKGKENTLFNLWLIWYIKNQEGGEIYHAK